MGLLSFLKLTRKIQETYTKPNEQFQMNALQSALNGNQEAEKKEGGKPIFHPKQNPMRTHRVFLCPSAKACFQAEKA